MKLTADEIKNAKAKGCLQDKRYEDVFNVRVLTRNGKITSREARAIAEAADKFGSGEVSMTVRLTQEIQGVKYENLEALFAFLKENGLETGGTGAKVRPVVSCKGTTCQYGLIDTYALSERIHNIFYKGYGDVKLPHKFKIAVGGCPNNCAKPDLNDIGIVGQKISVINEEKCKGCSLCAKNCPVKVIDMVDKKAVRRLEECNNCGRCVPKCPFGAIEEKTVGYKMYVGGRWGKRIAQGKALGVILTSEDAVIKACENAMFLFRDEGVQGERFSDTISRLGFEYVEGKILEGIE